MEPSWYDGCCCSVTQSCPTLCNAIDSSTLGSPVLHHLPELAQTHVHWVSEAIKPSHLCHPLLFLPSIFPSIKIFSNESVLRIWWPKYWSFSFSISPAMNIQDWFPLGWTSWIPLQSKSLTLKSLLQHYSSRASILRCSTFFIVPTLIHTWPLETP